MVNTCNAGDNQYLITKILKNLVLQSKLMYVNGNFDGGIIVLNKAQILAKKYNQLHLLEMIKSFKNEIDKTFIENYKLILNNVNLKKAIDERRILEFLKLVKKMSL